MSFQAQPSQTELKDGRGGEVPCLLLSFVIIIIIIIMKQNPKKNISPWGSAECYGVYRVEFKMMDDTSTIILH